MNIVIVEDEQPAARRLEKLITEIRPKARITRVMDSVEDAVEFFKNQSETNLVFLDIQLADGLSFDIFEKTELRLPVIFTTAYDHYAVKAFKVNSVDYLLKPVEPEELERALQRYEDLYAESGMNLKDVLQQIRSNEQVYKKRFLVKTAGRLAFIPVADVAYFFSEDGNTFLVNRTGEQFLLETILDELETQLDPINFFRINRKMIVALPAIRRIEPHFNNRFLLQLEPEFTEEIIVSRQRGAEFKRWLDS